MMQEIGPPPIEADSEVVEDIVSDSGYSDSSSFRGPPGSLTSSIREYRVIHGRTFQTSNTTDYWAPNDDTQLEAFDVTHHFTLLLMNDNLFDAPVSVQNSNLKVLDVGTGTGIWAIDVADQFPSAEVTGTDISAVQPDWVPPNCIFEIDDAQRDWTFSLDYFDLIHARNMYGAIDDWQRLYNQAFAHLKPGGWFESMEFDIQAACLDSELENDPGHVFKRWARLFWEAGDATGRTFRVAQNMGPNQEIMMVKCMRQAGFVDIVHRRRQVPIGEWPKDPRFKEIGQYAAYFMDKSLDGWALKPLGEILGWSFEEITDLVTEMRRALMDPMTLPYFN